MSAIPSRFDGLVNVRVTLTPVVSQAEEDSGPPPDGSGRVDGWTVGVADQALRMETDDPNVLSFDACTVTVDFHEPDRLYRLVARVDVLIRDPAPYVLAIRPLAVPEEIQRRNWVRTVAAIPVAIEIPVPATDVDVETATTTSAAKTDADPDLVTETLNISAGGACIVSMPGLEAGMRVHLMLTLPHGDEPIDAEVVEVVDGVARLSFGALNEGATTRITKHVFENIMAPRRATRQQPT